MSWTWRFENETGDPIVADADLDELGANSSFGSQADAEDWLGEVWRELAAADIAAVWLMEDSREVYGPMKLTAEA